VLSQVAHPGADGSLVRLGGMVMCAYRTIHDQILAGGGWSSFGLHLSHPGQIGPQAGPGLRRIYTRTVVPACPERISTRSQT